MNSISKEEIDNFFSQNANLQKIAQNWQKGCDFLNSDYPLLGGAMSWVSESSLVSAICNAGGFGVLACGAMEPHMLKTEIEKTKKLTNRSFGVNLITMHPMIEDLIEVCIQQEITHIVLGGSLPKSEAIKKIKTHNMKLICFAPNILLAKRMIHGGADALIIEGMEAGGHIGSVATSVLAQEILGNFEVPIFVAGGIGTGQGIASYLLMGACGCQMGTIFVCTDESIAHDNFKQIFIRSSARDAAPSVQVDPNFPVIPVRALKNKASEEFAQFQKQVIAEYKNSDFDKQEAQLKIEKYWAGALRKAVIDGDLENGSLMAGQSVGFVKKIQPVKNVIDDLLQEMMYTLHKTN